MRCRAPAGAAANLETAAFLENGEGQTLDGYCTVMAMAIGYNWLYIYI